MEKYYKCTNPRCNLEFSEEESNSVLEYGKNITLCPTCGNWDIDIGYQCTECDKWFPSFEVDDVILCKECYTTKLTELQDELKTFIDKHDGTDKAILEDYLDKEYC